MKRTFVFIMVCLTTFILCGCCLSHEWQEATCTEPKTCVKCGKIEGEALGHDYSDWKIVSAATYLKSGEREKTCVRCRDTISEEIPKLDVENCKIVTDSIDELSVTYDECYYLMEEIMSGHTSYYESKHNFSFHKTDSENIRDLYGETLNTKVMVTLMRDGDKPNPDDKIDYIYVLIAGDGDTISSKTPFFQLASIATIFLTNPDITTPDEALSFYNKVLDYTEKNNAWYKAGNMEYLGEIASVGKNAYLVSFASRIAGKY